jgi:hypothetical protein
MSEDEDFEEFLNSKLDEKKENELEELLNSEEKNLSTSLGTNKKDLISSIGSKNELNKNIELKEELNKNDKSNIEKRNLISSSIEKRDKLSSSKEKKEIINSKVEKNNEELELLKDLEIEKIQIKESIENEDIELLKDLENVKKRSEEKKNAIKRKEEGSKITIEFSINKKRENPTLEKDEEMINSNIEKLLIPLKELLNENIDKKEINEEEINTKIKAIIINIKKKFEKFIDLNTSFLDDNKTTIEQKLNLLEKVTEKISKALERSVNKNIQFQKETEIFEKVYNEKNETELKLLNELKLYKDENEKMKKYYENNLSNLRLRNIELKTKLRKHEKVSDEQIDDKIIEYNIQTENNNYSLLNSLWKLPILSNKVENNDSFNQDTENKETQNNSWIQTILSPIKNLQNNSVQLDKSNLIIDDSQKDKNSILPENVDIEKKSDENPKPWFFQNWSLTNNDKKSIDSDKKSIENVDDSKKDTKSWFSGMKIY